MNLVRKVRIQIISTFFLLILLKNANAQQGFKIYLVGDAGDHEKTEETLLNLKKELLNHPNSATIFMGDNCYKDMLWGIIPFGFKGFDSSQNTINKINAQLFILENYRGYAFFTPGNHDWWNRTTFKKGRGKLAMEESFIEKNIIKNLTLANPGDVFQPAHGGYGPAFVDINNHRIRLIFIDTYRIIQTGIKKGIVPEEEKSVYYKLDSLIREAYQLNEKIIIIAHHPVFAEGPYTEPIKHPYLFARIKASKLTFPSYHEMNIRINAILHKYPGIYYVSGHVHALQYFQTTDSIHYIISGAGSKTNKLSEKQIEQYNPDSPHDYLLWNSGGFFELSFEEWSDKIFLYYNSGRMKCEIAK